MADSLERFGARLHAYCWMTNHVHMVIQVSEFPLGRIILRAASAYARTVQLRLETTGHLFERRYHAVLVDADAYLLTLLRYIHLNPVNGGLTRDPDTYRWSSHHAYSGTRKPAWLTTDFALGILSPDPERAVIRYRELISLKDQLHWGTGALAVNPNQPQVLGSEEFVRRTAGPAGASTARNSLKDLLDQCSQRFSLPVTLLVSPTHNRRLVIARAWFAQQAAAAGIASICEVARFLGRTEGAIRQVMRRYPLETAEPTGSAQ